MYAIVMEYMEDGSLEDSLKSQNSLLLDDALRRITEACRGVERVHASGYVHRDVKPGNILTSGPITKLSDFGLAQLLNQGVGPGGGTPFYVAPEVISSGITSPRSDIYSLGVSLYELINGSSYLTWTGTTEAFARAVVRGAFPDRSEYAPFVTPALQKVIKKALQVDPLKRYASVADFRHALGNVRIACSWQQEADAEESWLGMGMNGLFRVQVALAKGALEVSRCKTAPGSFRKISADCLYKATSVELRKKQRLVMQRITVEGR
jgi:serine/threonine-protein kinase